MISQNRRSTDDWLDSDEFKNAMRRYWITSLNWHARIDEVKSLIRANYQPPPNRTTRILHAKIAELQAWIDKLTEEKTG